jgi:hypothetical protein
MGEIDILCSAQLSKADIFFFALFKSHTGSVRFSPFKSKMDKITGAE